MAKHLHELVYTVTTIETLVHQFIDRELLGDADNHQVFRRRESGAKLQDTLDKMRDNPLKPAVKASLLSGGIASLLYLFAILVRLFPLAPFTCILRFDHKRTTSTSGRRMFTIYTYTYMYI